MPGGFCSCIPPPASIQPRKIYNVLVPDVFGNLGTPHRLEEPLPSGTLRKIGKLQEYVQKNPSKAAKVSRRLTRRIKSALYERAFGDVKVAVHAYKHLLFESTAPDSSYTFSYFTKELIQQPDAVIHQLLTFNHNTIQTLGATLLGAYIHAQSEIESQPDVDAALVEVACNTAATAAEKERQQPKGGANLGALDLDALQVACLVAMREYVVLCHKLRILPSLLEQIEVSVLDIIENDEHGKAWLLERAQEKLKKPPPMLRALSQGAAKPPPSSSGSHHPFGSGNSFLQKLGSLRHPNVAHHRRPSKEDQHKPQQHKSEADAPPKQPPPAPAPKPQEPQRPIDAALDVLSSYHPFLRDISTVRRVMETLLSWLDRNNRWDRKELVEGLLALVQSFAGDLTFPLTSCLMRHCSTPESAKRLSAHQRAIIVRLAAQQGVTYSLSALSLALSELPRALLLLPSDASSQQKDELRYAVHEAVRELAIEVGDAEQVCEAVGLVLRGSNMAVQQSAPTSALEAALETGHLRLCTLQCGLTVVSAIPEFSGRGSSFSGSVLPPTLLRALADMSFNGAVATAAAAAHAGAPLQQQLWKLQHLQGATTAKLLQGMLAPLSGSGLRDERQALLLLQLSAQWLGMLGTPPLPSLTSEHPTATPQKTATPAANGSSAFADASQITLDLGNAPEVTPATMVPPPPAFELAAQLASVALTCARGPGPALGAARLALHAHCAALRSQPPFPLDLKGAAAPLRSPSGLSHNSTMLPHPPSTGDINVPRAKSGGMSADEEPRTPDEAFESPAASNFNTPAGSFRAKSGVLSSSNSKRQASQELPISVDPSMEPVLAKWRAGMLVFADVLALHLQQVAHCPALSACEIKDARGLVPELSLSVHRPGHPHLTAAAPLWSQSAPKASNGTPAQLSALMAGLKERRGGGGLGASWWASKLVHVLSEEKGCILKEAFGATALSKQLHAPLECSSSCDADVACSSWLANGSLSRGASGIPPDSSLADSMANGDAAKLRMSANGAPQGWTALGRGHNPPVSVVRNMLVDESDSELDD